MWVLVGRDKIRRHTSLTIYDSRTGSIGNIFTVKKFPYNKVGEDLYTRNDKYRLSNIRLFRLAAYVDHPKHRYLVSLPKMHTAVWDVRNHVTATATLCEAEIRNVRSC